MQHLQREVDLALEYFSRETEHELDDFDGDEYLKQPEKYQRVGGDDERSDGTAATSLANSIVTEYDNECSGDWHNMNSLSLSEQSSTVSDQQMPTRPLLGAPVAAAVAPAASGSLSLQHKTKSILSLPLMLLPSRVTTDCSEAEDDASIKFEDIISHELKKTCRTDEQGKNNNNSVDFISNSSLRNAMEPFLAVARKLYDLLCYYCGLLCMKTKLRRLLITTSCKMIARHTFSIYQVYEEKRQGKASLIPSTAS